ncbi:DNA helicase-2 / ATP-dependent DNA helicase PcrA [Paenibacillus algorifonticola]|uniref:DNA helicase-2 / ATP-dependent DNA helicase PcrA n=1 Tax=Paenibacillus algorifonticola TaxID=684063 RepID=A0A1I2CIE1_9BACL|nr:UvrD-helicase domain-containing protein [Paenibacillus algorifonticola]SFE68081.1 DNA helicase-2 / ATP-dependent DNA helicase PcrA [Paenibacillus algorifonticola]
MLDIKSNKLVIAAAGSGKTTFLVNEALRQREGKVLITTFTQGNEAEIRKKFVELNGCVPSHVTIQTWFSTLLQHGIRPYQGGLYDETIRGMLLVNEPSALRYIIKKTGFKVYYGEADYFSKHYFTDDSKVYSDKISKLVVRCNERSNGAVIERLNKIFTHIFIDEIQDLAGYDLEILKLLLKSKSNILFVGDPRQVTYLTHIERKYDRYKEGRIKEFIQTECRRVSCEIDEDTLNVSHRNNAMICDYSSKLYSQYKPCQSNQHEVTGHDGIYLVRKQDVDLYLQRYNPVQLRDSIRETINKNYKSINFGESKGLTFDRVLIYPTQPFIRWINNNNFELPPTSCSKLYVALTRAKYSVGIIYDYDEATNLEGLQKFFV